MSVIQELVTDRTESDVEEWKRLKALGIKGMSKEELAKWNSGMKGTYTEKDFNRVCNAYNYLAEIYKEYGLISDYEPLPTNWGRNDSVYSEQLAEFLYVIRELKEVSKAGGNLPDTLEGLTYQGANEIEKVLLNIYERVGVLDVTTPKAGMYYAGEIDA